MRATYRGIASLVVVGLFGATLVAQAPANATAKCKDGTYSTSTTSQGMCSGHGGVASKITPKPAAKPKAKTASTTSTKSTTATKSTKSSSARPAGATAKCEDGTYSTAKSTQGACSSHGGVAVVLAAPEEEAAPAKKAKETSSGSDDEAVTTHRPTVAPADATAKCKDGTYSASQQHSGACSHHGGVAEWYR